MAKAGDHEFGLGVERKRFCPMPYVTWHSFLRPVIVVLEAPPASAAAKIDLVGSGTS
jgi:hypothetical protein